MTTRTATLAPLAAALALCACDTVPQDAIESCEGSHVMPGAVSTDILFVIDDSISMGNEQTQLRDGLAAFIQTLASSPVVNDFQVGVTTTSVADFTGAAVGAQGSLVGAGIMSGSSPTLVADFQATVLVGTGGSNREQPFEAVRLALEKSATGGANEGFLRPGAKLAIIFLSDEDDCSGPRDTGSSPVANSADCAEEKFDPASTLMPVSQLVSLLNGPIAGEVRETVAAAVVGVAPGTLELSCGLNPPCTNNACSTATDKGDRYVELLGGLGAARTRLASICTSSFDQALSDFAGVIMSQTLPLDGAPADWRMLVASVDRADATIGCTIAPWDAANAERAAADAIYEPPQAGRPAALTFQNDCALQQGDRVNVKAICAG